MKIKNSVLGVGAASILLKYQKLMGQILPLQPLKLTQD